jgi:hypothetical protein
MADNRQTQSFQKTSFGVRCEESTLRKSNEGWVQGGLQKVKCKGKVTRGKCRRWVQKGKCRQATHFRTQTRSVVTTTCGSKLQSQSAPCRVEVVMVYALFFSIFFRIEFWSDFWWIWGPVLDYFLDKFSYLALLFRACFWYRFSIEFRMDFWSPFWFFFGTLTLRTCNLLNHQKPLFFQWISMISLFRETWFWMISLIFLDTISGIDFWCVLASISAPFWEPFAIIFYVFLTLFFASIFDWLAGGNLIKNVSKSK